MNDYRAVTLREEPSLLPAVRNVIGSAWPEFMLHDAVADQFWDSMYELLPEFQIAIVDRRSGEVAAVANAAPVLMEDLNTTLPDRGWDWALETAISGLKSDLMANCLCGLSVSVAPGHRGKGLSGYAVDALLAKTNEFSFSALIIPVRPSLKSRYPLIEMERYVRWRNADGLPFDPWLRVHVRHGAAQLNVCARSMQIGGKLSEWEKWTQMLFPESGAYVIPDALVPVHVDYESDRALYVEPNVWVRYDAG